MTKHFNIPRKKRCKTATAKVVSSQGDDCGTVESAHSVSSSAEPVDLSGCVHHYVIGTASVCHMNHGVCRKCGRERWFQAAVADDYSYNQRSIDLPGNREYVRRPLPEEWTAA